MNPRPLLLLVIACLLAGCASQGANFFTEPLYIRCKGKGWTNIMVGPYSGRVESDCGDGFLYSLERAPAKP